MSSSSNAIDKTDNRFAYVYVLASKTGKRTVTYVGWTFDVDARLKAHNSGKGAKSTKGKHWTLIHQECFGTKEEAMSREVHLKRDRSFRTQLRNTFALESENQNTI